MDEGYIKLSRRFFSNIMWIEARTFSGCEAWLDLIQSARFDATPRKVSIGGREVSYQRGQYPASIRFLSQRWKWSEKKVRSFLEHLKKEEMITTDCSQGVNIITLCKYDEYNDTGTAKDTVKGTDTDKIINDLRAEWAQLRAQLGAQPPEKGHTEGTNTNKGEEREYIKESPNGDKKVDFPSGCKVLENPSKACIDYQHIADTFNELCGNDLPKVFKLNDGRKSSIKARVKECGVESVYKAIELVSQSDFLLGRTGGDWICTFDWIFKPRNFLRILEGNYNRPGSKEASSELQLKFRSYLESNAPMMLKMPIQPTDEEIIRLRSVPVSVLLSAVREINNKKYLTDGRNSVYQTIIEFLDYDK